MSQVNLFRNPTGGTAKNLVASYGQAEEFYNALPGLMGPLPDMVDYSMSKGGNNCDTFYHIMVISRMVAGRITRTRYIVEGL